MSEYLNIIENSTPGWKKELRICHTTEFMNFKEIVETGKIMPNSYLKLFKNISKERGYTYFFYGRPVMRWKVSREMVNPVSLIFKYELIKDIIDQIFPFDSGAYERYQKRDLLDKNRNLIEFSVPGDSKNSNKIVNIFFDGLNKYYKSMCRHQTNCGDILSARIQDCHGLYLERPENDLDTRKSTIELIIREEICLPNDNLEYILLAESSIRYKNIMDKIYDRWNFQKDHIWTYDDLKGNPEGIFMVLYNDVRRINKREELM